MTDPIANRALRIVPSTIAAAQAYVTAHHRHHRAPQGALFAPAIADEHVRGVAIVGRPVARMLSDGVTAEVTRLCTDGVHNGCSMLYGAAWRAARALGYKRLVTYILASETGTSLRATGWREVGGSSGGTWSRPSRARVDAHPLEPKVRWEVTCE